MNTGKTFQERWAFPNDVKKALGAASFDIRPLPESFRSGRPKFEALFFTGDRKLISRRLAMELVSKRTGRPYNVCERDEPSRRGLAPPAPLRRAPLTLDDLFDENDELPPPLPLRRETTADYLP